FLTQVRITFWRGRESVGDRLQVEPAPADDERDGAESDLGDFGPGQSGEARSITLIRNRQFTEKMVGDEGAILRWGRGAEDLQTAIYLKGVGVDDFDRGELTRQFQSNRGFPAASLAGEVEGRKGIAHR